MKLSTIIQCGGGTFLLVLDQLAKRWSLDSLLVYQDAVDPRLYQGSRLSLLPSCGDTNNCHDILALTHVRNFHAAWNQLSFIPEHLASGLLALGAAIVAIAIAGFLIINYKRTQHLLLSEGIILVGILSNLLDRLSVGYVIDWIDVNIPLGSWFIKIPAFNIADVLIVCGGCALILRKIRMFHSLLNSGLALLFLLCPTAWGQMEQEPSDLVESLRRDITRRVERKIQEIDSHHAEPARTDLSGKRRNSLLGIGLYYLKEKNWDLATHYLSLSSGLTAPQDPVKSLIQFYLFQAYAAQKTAPSVPAEADLEQIERLFQSKPMLSSWRGDFWHAKIQRLIQRKIAPQAFVREYHQYRNMISLSQRRPETLFLAAQYLEAHSQPTLAVQALEEAARDYPFSAESILSFQRLSELSCVDSPQSYVWSVDLLQRLGSNVSAANGLRELLVGLSQGKVKNRDGVNIKFTKMERAEHLFKSRLYSEALESVKDAFDSFLPHQKAEIDRTHFLLAQLWQKMGDPLTAAQHLLQIPKLSSAMIPADDRTELLADFYSALRNHQEAAKLYGSILLRGGREPVVKWHYFWNTYLNQDYHKGLELIKNPNLVSPRDPALNNNLDYWEARIREKMGHHEEAKKIYQHILKEQGDSFESTMVLWRHPDLALEPTTIKPSLPQNLEEDHAPLDFDQHTLDTLVALVLELSELGVRDVAQNILKILYLRDPKSSPTKLKFWMAVAQKIEGHRLIWESIHNPKARVGWNPKKASWENIKKNIIDFNQDWRIAFPIAFRSVIEPVAIQTNVDYFLILSLMKHESAFDLSAKSSVGAKGLLQMMPFTAVKMARVLDDPSSSLDDIYSPETNIAYATFYMRKLLNYYHQNVILAVAAYNAGPLAVDRWLQSYGDLEPDEFIDSIPYKETRRYVKNVMKTYCYYNLIYRNLQSQTLIQKLPRVPNHDDSVF